MDTKDFVFGKGRQTEKNAKEMPLDLIYQIQGNKVSLDYHYERKIALNSQICLCNISRH
jgi:hypothetical protein